MQTDTQSNLIEVQQSDDGYRVGQSSSSLVSFYGVAPVVQPTAAAQAAIVDPGDGTAAPTNGVLSLTGTYNSTILENSFATILAQTNAIRTALVNVGIMKGS